MIHLMPSVNQPDHSRFLYGLLMAGIGAILFSGKAIIIKLAYVYGTDSATILALRMLMALPIFWLIYWKQPHRKEMSPLSKLDIMKIMGLGFTGYFLSSYLDFLGLQYISVGLERIVLYLTPTIVLLISYFALKKAISRTQWYALIIGYLGVIVVFVEDAQYSGLNAWLGMILVFGAACTYAVYMIGSGEMVKRIGSIRLVVFASTTSAVLSVIQVLLIHANTIFTQAPEVYWLSLINASLCTVLPMLLIMMSINRIGSPLVAQAGILGPISTIFMGSLFLSEPISNWQISGMMLVIVAMWFLVKSDKPNKIELQSN